MTCKLSIIIPIYNAENYISNCLKSIFAQSFSDYEVVLVNDGSKDKSLDMCKKLPMMTEELRLLIRKTVVRQAQETRALKLLPVNI